MVEIGPRIYADFHNSDEDGRLRLNCLGTVEDLSQQKIELREGLRLTLYSDDVNAQGQLDELLADAVVAYSEKEHCWVAVIDWSAIRHSSDDRVPPAISPLSNTVAPAAPTGFAAK